MKKRYPSNPFRTITCETCGTVVTKRMEQGRRFCSRECVKADVRPQRKTGKMCACLICGKEDYITLARLNKMHFCCKAHADEWQSRNKKSYSCKMCGVWFQRSPSFEKFSNIKYCSKQCYLNDPETQTRLRGLNALQGRLKGTSIERLGYAELENAGIVYLPQHLIAEKFCVDAFLPEHNIVVQFDGDYWHGHPSKYPEPDKRQRKRMALDKSQDAYLAKCGIKVIRLWGSDIQNNPSCVTTSVLSATSSYSNAKEL